MTNTSTPIRTGTVVLTTGRKITGRVWVRTFDGTVNVAGETFDRAQVRVVLY